MVQVNQSWSQREDTLKIRANEFCDSTIYHISLQALITNNSKQKAKMIFAFLIH